MKIAVIGAGFTGLSASFELLKKGNEVTLFEKDNYPGGLAIGYKEEKWDWSLEKHYHHWFTNDKYILGLAKEINYDVLIKRPKTSIYVKNKIFQLDSPINVLKFPLISLFERLRMAAVLGLLKYNPYWKPLEKFNASKVLPRVMGKNPYKMIWEPLFINKFGSFSKDVSLAWFWARINKRTPSLAYPKGGYLNFANTLVDEIKKRGGIVFFDSEILEIKKNGKISISYLENKKKKTSSFDKAIVTLPSFLFLKMAPQLPETYRNNLIRLKGLGATNLVLRLKEDFLKDDTYWLSICDDKSPIMAIVEHTHFMDKKHFNNENIVYLGNYLSMDHKFFNTEKEEILKIYDPYLKKINKRYKENLIGFEVFKAPFAQPIIPVNYSKMIPPFKTPLKDVYLANIEQVYPWDRGTNYAVELGQKVAKIIIDDES